MTTTNKYVVPSVSRIKCEFQIFKHRDTYLHLLTAHTDTHTSQLESFRSQYRPLNIRHSLGWIEMSCDGDIVSTGQSSEFIRNFIFHSSIYWIAKRTRWCTHSLNRHTIDPEDAIRLSITYIDSHFGTSSPFDEWIKIDIPLHIYEIDAIQRNRSPKIWVRCVARNKNHLQFVWNMLFDPLFQKSIHFTPLHTTPRWRW